MSRAEPILQEVFRERLRQQQIGMNKIDANNTPNDYVAYICAYAGRAARKVHRNDKQNELFRENMVKVAALAVAAIERYDEAGGVVDGQD